MTQIFQSLSDWRQLRNQPEFNAKKIGFVPTMGNLHAGHASLLERCQQENDISVLSIFVNPTQFNNPDDLKNYPRTFEQDLKMAESIGVHYVIYADQQQFYPDEYRYKISESDFSKLLCGKYRPGHFDGMLTIVLKLLMLIKPHRLYLGEKDFQQLQLIKGMIEAFFLDTKIVACQTVRNQDSLALSSRYHAFTPEELTHAAQFAQLLRADLPLAVICEKLISLGFKIDYIEEHFNRRFGAVHLGKVRLIDNVELKSC